MPKSKGGGGNTKTNSIMILHIFTIDVSSQQILLTLRVAASIVCAVFSVYTLILLCSSLAIISPKERPFHFLLFLYTEQKQKFYTYLISNIAANTYPM